MTEGAKINNLKELSLAVKFIQSKGSFFDMISPFKFHYLKESFMPLVYKYQVSAKLVEGFNNPNGENDGLLECVDIQSNRVMIAPTRMKER